MPPPRLSAHGAALTELVLELFRVHGLVLAAGDQLAAPSGLSSARWQILGVVDHGAATVAQVARTMGLTRQSVRQTAEALARDGFIVHVDNPADLRAQLIALTPAGRRALRQVEARHAVWADRLAADLDQATVQVTLAGLRDLARRLQPPPATRKQKE